MSGKDPQGESQGSLVGLRDVFSRLGFDVGSDSIKFTPAQKMNQKRGRKRQVGEKLHSVTTINQWHLSEREQVALSLSLDIGLLQENLKESVSRFFGTKAEAEIHFCQDGIIDVAILVTQPATKTTERGYLNLPREDDLPIGCFGFKLKIVGGSEGLIIQMLSTYGLGYLPNDFLLAVEDWLFAGFGVEGIGQNSVKRSHFSEFNIHVDALVLSAVGAKDSERRQAVEFLKKWREKNSARGDYRLEWELEDVSLHITSLNPGERRPVQAISVSTLEIREMIRQNEKLEKAFILGQWVTVSEIIEAEKNTEKNNYLELRAALMILMVSFPTKYRGVVELLKRSGESLESLSAKLRVSDNSTERLALLSKMTNSVLEKFEFAEASKGIGRVFSEYLGDLWSYEDIEIAVECYDRALEMDKNSGRLLRKKKNLYSLTKHYEKAIEVLEILISVEPRKVEISKLMIEKGGYLLALGRINDAVSAGELAVSNDRLSPKATLFLASALRLGGQFAESVQSLDDLLCLDNGLLSSRQKSELNTVIGQTWLYDLNSFEIAASRLRIAIELDPESELAHRLLAESLERSGRFEEQIKILEKYLLIVEKMDDEDAINWAQDKITTQAREVSELSASHRINNLKRILNKDRINFSQVALLMDSHRIPDEWHLIITTLSQRVSEIQSLEERGMIFERLAIGARDVLIAPELSDHFFTKAWEIGYLSEEIFLSNFARLVKISDNLGLADLCEQWIEKDLPNRILLLRDCIDRELPIDTITMDRWVVEAVRVNPENVDIAILRLQQLIRIDNCVEVVKIWTLLVESGLGIIRRRRVFNYLKDYLREKEMFDVLLEAYLAFSQKSDDQWETLKEAIDILEGRIDDSDLGLLVRQCVLANYLTNLSHERLVSVLSNYPSELKKYYLLRAVQSSDSRKALANIISAMNIFDSDQDHSSGQSIDKMIKAIIGNPEQSEWFGIENIKALVYSQRHTKFFIKYLAWWIPKIELKEKIQSVHILIDLLKIDKKSPDESLEILDEVITEGHESILNERIASILMESSRANRSYRIKIIIESNKGSKDSFLEAASNINPVAFGESLVDVFQLMVAFQYNSIEKLNLYIDSKIYSHQDSGKKLDEAVRQYILSSLEESDREFKFWFCNHNFSHLTQALISGIFNLENSYKARSENILSNLTNCLFEICQDWKLLQKATIWILFQLKYLQDLDVIRKIFLSLNPTVFTHPGERIQAYLICKRIGDLMRAKFFASQILQSLDPSPDSLRSIFGGDYSDDELTKILVEIKEYGQSVEINAAYFADDQKIQSNLNLENTALNIADDPISISIKSEESAAPLKEVEQKKETTNTFSSSELTMVSSEKTPEEPHEDQETVRTVFPQSRFGLTEPTVNQNDSPNDWREFIRENRVGGSHLLLVKNSDSVNPIEKHVALQALALSSGSLKSLNDWKWNVWRNRTNSEFPFSIESRFPEHAVSSSLIEPFAMFLKEIYPMVVMNLWEKCSLGGLAASAGLSEDQLIAKLRIVEWNNPYFLQAGIGLLSQRFQDIGYRVYEFAGIKDKIWLDASRRFLVCDLDYFKSFPPSVLFFSFLSKHWEVMSRFQVYLDSSASFEAFPVIKIIYDYFLEDLGFDPKDSSLKKNVKGVSEFSIPRQVLDEQASHVDRKKLKKIMNELSSCREADFVNHQFVMRSHIHRLCLAESLDLIGLIEFITKRDMLENPPQSITDLVGLSKYIQPLLKFVLQMNLREN